MASILVTSSPLLGHVSPCMEIGAAMAARGHRVRMLTGSRHRTRIEKAGLSFRPLPAAADFDDRDMAAAFPQVAGLTGIKGLSAAVLEVFARPIGPQHEAVQAALAEEPTDVILSEMLFGGVYPVALRPRPARPAVGIIGISPMTLPARGLAPYAMGLLPARNPLERVRNAALHVPANLLVLRPAQRFLAAEIHRLTGKRLRCSYYEMPGLGDALLQLSVPGFEYPRPRARTELIFVGPLPAKAATGEVPPWHADLDGRYVVHVTQGTVANSTFDTLVVPTVEALADSDCLVVVTGGGRPAQDVATAIRARLGRVPDNVRISEFLDYSWLFPRLDLLVTNGGFGAVSLAMTHGVPLIMAGNTEEKNEVGARIQWSGVGVRLRSATPTVADLAAAIEAIRAGESYRTVAARLREEIRQAPGFDAIEDFIRRNVPAERSAAT